MTKRLLMILSLLAFTLCWTPAQAEETGPKTGADLIASNPDLAGRIIEVEVNGMVCDFCAQSLTKVLEKKEAVDNVTISLDTKLVIITLAEGQSLTDDAVKEAVTWAGYETAGIKRL